MLKPTRYYALGVIVVALAAVVSVTADEAADSLHFDGSIADTSRDVGVWKAVAASGVVEALLAVDTSEPWVRVRRGDELDALTEVRTGRRGRATLTRSSDLLIVDPESVVRLPEPGIDSPSSVVQTEGSVLYEIEGSEGREFKVMTPYLVAGVKGTVFMVTVRNDTASVTVEDGVVEVLSLASGEVTDLHAGDTVLVGAEPGQELDVMTRNRSGSDGGATDKESRRLAQAESKRLLRVLERGQEDLLIAAELGELDPDDPLLVRSFAVTAPGLRSGPASTVRQEDGVKVRSIEKNGNTVEPKPEPEPIDPGTEPAPEPTSGGGKTNIKETGTGALS